MTEEGEVKNVISVIKRFYILKCLYYLLLGYMNGEIQGSGLLNDDTLIKTNVSMVVYWMMIFWLKQSYTCVNGGLLNDDILIKT